MFEKAQAFFEKARKLPEIHEIDQTVQFRLSDDNIFYVRVEDGKISVSNGETTPDFWNVLNIQTNKKTINDILDGRLTLGEAILEERLKVLEMAKKPVIAWFGRIIRKTQQDVPKPLKT